MGRERKEKREREKSVRKRLSVKSVLAGNAFCLVTAGAAAHQSDCFIALSGVGLHSFSDILLALPLSLGAHGNFVSRANLHTTTML